MRMELQALIPGMKGGSEAADGGEQSFVVGQFFGQGGRDGAEEQIIGLFGKGAEEAPPQFGWEGKGDQEVGGLNQFTQFALDPAVCGQRAALGTGFVVAGVIGEMDLVAGFADKGASAQGRSAAMSDGPDGAALLR